MRNRAVLLLSLVSAMVLACSGIVLAQQGPTAPDSQQQTPTSDRGGQPSFAEEKKAGAVVPDRYIVVLKDNENSRSVAEEHRSERAAEVSHVYEHALRGYAARIPSNRLPEIEADSRVQFVQQDRTAVAVGQTKPTGIARIQADQSSTLAGNGSGSVNVGVAVLDTGINKTHPDLNHKGGRNFATWGSSNDKYEDGNGHGTHVAGTIGAKDDANGAVGVAPGTPLYGVKVLDNRGSGYQSWIIAGIDWVTKNNSTIKVANMSIGGWLEDKHDDGNCGKTNGDAYHLAICNSTDAGITYVVAAGNDTWAIEDDYWTAVPAAYDEVLTVTAESDSDGKSGGIGSAPSCRTGEKDDYPASFSNWAEPPVYSGWTDDRKHTIALPGVCIYSTWKSGGYKTISGTSMASPHGAGMAALYKAKDPSATPSQVMTALRSNAEAKDTDNAYGFKGDPNSSPTSNHYDYLGYAGGY